MSAKHTPGPWVFKPAGRKTHAALSMAGSVLVFKTNISSANARLIAAAPDLLKSLVELVEWVEEGDHDENFLAPARAAIARATGEQP